MDILDIMEKLLNIRNFVNRVLTTVYDKHTHIGNILITSIDELKTIRTIRLGDITIRYIYDSSHIHSEILEVDETGISYYDNLIIDILKSIMIEFSHTVPEERYWCDINLNNTNDKIIELRNYSDEELKLYFKLK